MKQNIINISEYLQYLRQNFLKKESFHHNALLLIFGTALSQGIQLAVWPFITRLYDPSSFGCFSTYMAIVIIVGSVIALKYDQAIILPQDEARSKDLLRFAALVVVLLSIVVFMVIILWERQLTILVGLRENFNFTWFIPLSLLFFGLTTLYMNWNIRTKTFKIIAFSSITQVSVSSSVQIMVAIFYKAEVIGLLIGQIVGQILALILLLPKHWVNNFNHQKAQLRNMLEMAERYKEFPHYMIMAGLLNVSTTYIPIFILGSFFSTTTVGFYALSQRVINAPMSLIGGNIATVFTKKAHELATTDIFLLKKKSFQMSATMLVIGLLPAGILFCFSPPLFHWIFGAKWEMAGRFTQVMSIYLLLQFAFSPLAVLFRVLESQKLYSLWEWIRFIICFLTILVGSKFLSPLGAVTCFSLGMSFSYIILACFSWYLLSQRSH